MIFITNIDFQAKIAKQGKMANHFQALISRSLYLDLTMKTVRDRIIRIDDIFSAVMAPQMGLSKAQAKEIMEFVADHADRMIDLSLRLMVHVVDLFHLGGDWKKMVEITKMRNIL